MVSHQWEKWYHTIGKNGITPLGLGLGYQKIVGRSVYVRQCFNPERTVHRIAVAKRWPETVRRGEG
jgi:hypothetical protein